MHKVPYKVWVVLDPHFGERLATLPIDEPVWIIGSPANIIASERLWKQRPGSSHLTGITVFDFYEDLSAEEALLDQLDSIDLHHGEHSAKPPYSVIEFIGSVPSTQIVVALGELGFHVESSDSDRFVAVRNTI